MMMFKDRDTLKSSDIYDKTKSKNKQEDTIGYKECSPKHQLREKREFQRVGLETERNHIMKLKFEEVTFE